MIKETMTSKERVWAAIKGERVDRTPVDILATPVAYANMVGMTLGEMLRKPNEIQKAINYTFDYVGGWDLDVGSIPFPSAMGVKILFGITQGIKMKVAGLDLPDDYGYQCDEQEFLKYEDYETIADIGWTKFMMKDFIHRVVPDLTYPVLMTETVRIAPLFFRAMYNQKKRGVMSMVPYQLFVLHPFFRFSLGRSMLKFMEDLYKRPVEPIERALQKVTDEYVQMALFFAKTMRQKIFLLVEERASGTFFPLHIFERFWWPYTKQIVNTLNSKGLKVWFHLDTSWDKNMSYFKELPRRSAVLALDSTTDMVAARQVLGDHLCFAGDVPAALLSLGEPEEVEAYCQKLIKEVGPGGLILSSGCEMPPVVKKENWRAMVQTAKNYMPY